MGDVRVRPSEWIVAVVTTEPHRVGGGVPVFYATSREELEQMVLNFSRFTLASAHEVLPGTVVIMRH